MVTKKIMSRIGNLPIQISQSVTVKKAGSTLSVTGPKGTLNLEIDPSISIEVEDDKVIVKRKNDLGKVRALHGLTRNLIANIITGVTEGFSKNLELVGVGFRAQSDGSRLTLNIGFSHPVEILAPEGITFEVKDTTKITVSGIDKQLVGQTTANIRKIKIPDVYKGKGIRYEGEYIRKKAGKAAKAEATGTGTGTKGV